MPLTATQRQSVAALENALGEAESVSIIVRAGGREQQFDGSWLASMLAGESASAPRAEPAPEAS